MSCLSIVLFILAVACEPKWKDPFERFTIKEGKHYSTYRTELLQNYLLSFEAKFDSSVIYQTKTEENQFDINKLFGFSDCNSHHQEHSARFGWRRVTDSVEIFAYSYVNEERISKLLGKTAPFTVDQYQLVLTDDAYIYHFNERKVSIPRTQSCDLGVYYLLFPYFGGNETAPHDIDIYIKRQY